jgi:hypothetical protein
MLYYNFNTPDQQWLLSIAFLLSSLLIFRLLDDLGSIKVDRLDHSERTHLLEENQKTLFNVFGLVSSAYLIVWNYVGFENIYLVGSFLILQVILYVIFQKNITILYILPFLKYPVLLISLTDLTFQYNHVLPAIGSIFLMLAYDTIESRRPIPSILLLLAAGFCFLHALPLKLLFGALLFPLVIIWFLVDNKYLKYFPLLYFPIVVFVYNSFF